MARTGTKSKDEDFHIRVPADLRAAFEATAETVHHRQPEAGYDDWFRAQVQASIDDPRPSIPHDEVMQRTRAVIDNIALDKSRSLGSRGDRSRKPT
jgi:hypothetical protein